MLKIPIAGWVLPVPGGLRKHDVGALGNEVESAEMRDDIAFERTLEGEVEILEGLAGGEPCRADAAFAAVVLAGGDFAFETRGEGLLMGPALGLARSSGPFERLGERHCLGRAAEVCNVGRGSRGGHHTTPRARS